jgi:hypothetical protein
MRVVILSFALLFSGAAAAADSYLCISDQATGFAFNKETDQWYRANFQTGEKYVLSREKGGWVLKQFGEEAPLLHCPGDFNAGNNLICSDGGTDFRMNRHLLRYQKAYLVGYYVDYGALGKLPPGLPAMEEGGDTPVLEIGRCSAL